VLLPALDQDKGRAELSIPTFETTRNGSYLSSIIDLTPTSANLTSKLRVACSIQSLPYVKSQRIEFWITNEETESVLPRNSTYLFNTKTAGWDLFKSAVKSEMDSS